MKIKLDNNFLVNQKYWSFKALSSIILNIFISKNLSSHYYGIMHNFLKLIEV